MNAKDIYEFLIEKGHTIGYTTVCNYIRNTRNKRKELFILQQPVAGDGIEFDLGRSKTNDRWSGKTAYDGWI